MGGIGLISVVSGQCHSKVNKESQLCFYFKVSMAGHCS